MSLVELKEAVSQKFEPPLPLMEFSSRNEVDVYVLFSFFFFSSFSFSFLFLSFSFLFLFFSFRSISLFLSGSPPCFLIPEVS